MGDDDRKLSFSERDRLNREGGGRSQSGQARAEDERKSRDALSAADALFAGDKGREEEKGLTDAVRAAHGSADLPVACQAYLASLGPPSTHELASIFLDAGVKELSVMVLDGLLRQKAADGEVLDGGLKRQVRILSEDFDDDLASRAEELLE